MKKEKIGNYSQEAKEINNSERKAKVIYNITQEAEENIDNHSQKSKTIYNSAQKADWIDNSFQEAKKIYIGLTRITNKPNTTKLIRTVKDTWDLTLSELISWCLSNPEKGKKILGEELSKHSG